MFKIYSRNTRTRWEICSKLTIKTPGRCHWCCSGVFIVNFEHFTPCSSVSIVNFEKVNADWGRTKDLNKDQTKSNISPTNWFFMYRKLCKATLWSITFFKYTQIVAWMLWFLKTLFNQVWSDSAIVLTVALIVWQWYGIFNGSVNFAS